MSPAPFVSCSGAVPARTHLQGSATARQGQTCPELLRGQLGAVTAAQPLRRHLAMHLSPNMSILNNEVVTRGTTSKIVGLPNKRHFSLVKPSIKATLLC